MSQRQVARLAEISPSQTSRYLRGESSPNLHEYVVLCDAIGVHPDTLLSQAIHNIRWREQYAKDDEYAVPIEGQVRYNLDLGTSHPRKARHKKGRRPRVRNTGTYLPKETQLGDCVTHQ